jgi:hypothetical protein
MHACAWALGVSNLQLVKWRPQLLQGSGPQVPVISLKDKLPLLQTPDWPGGWALLGGTGVSQAA